MRHALHAGLVLATLLFLAACGQEPAVVSGKQGPYDSSTAPGMTDGGQDSAGGPGISDSGGPSGSAGGSGDSSSGDGEGVADGGGAGGTGDGADADGEGVAEGGGAGGTGDGEGTADGGGIGGTGDGEGVADGGGIGGTGGGGTTAITSVGTITEFGSVFVNGVEFETPEAVLINDLQASEAELRIGMVVRVEGTVNADGLTGVANSITFHLTLKGPITAILETDQDAVSKALLVLGHVVVVDSAATVFDEADPEFTFDSLITGTVVAVSGFVDTNGVLRATYIKGEGAVEYGATDVMLSGFISGLNDAGSLMLDGVTVAFDPSGEATQFVGLGAGELADGLKVRVRGVLTNPMEVAADRIKAVTSPFGQDPQAVSIEGPVGAFNSLADFRVNGIPVDGGQATWLPEDLSASLDNGSHVTVAGALVEGVLIADSITDVGASYGSEPIVVGVQGAVGAFTSLDDFRVSGQLVAAGDAAFEPEALAEIIGNGTHVIVTGPIVSGVLMATAVEATTFGAQSDEGLVTTLRGIVSSFSGLDDFKVFGRTVDATGATFDPPELAISLAVGSRVVVEGVMVGPNVTAYWVGSAPPAPGRPTLQVTLSGEVRGFDGIHNFKVGQRNVDASHAVFSPASLAESLAEGAGVTVVGEWVQGVLVAWEVISNE